MSKYTIVVSVKELTEVAEFADAGHDWVLDGDYGFLGSFATQSEAWARAEEEAEGINYRDGAGTVSVQLNA